MVYKYNNLVVGGTFDRLHAGHKAFLRYAFFLSEKVYITITSDAYARLHKPQAASFEKRVKNIEKFLAKENLLQRAHIFSIDTVYGIAPEENIPLQAILVTDDTLRGAQKVNEKRKALHLAPLIIEVMQRISGKTGIPLSSTYIRQGVFDRKGDLQVRKEIIENTSHMPEMLRTELQKPFGEITNPESLKTQDAAKLIAVGDVTTRLLHENGISPSLSIIDFTVERKRQNTSLRELGLKGTEKIYRVTNPPSILTPDLWKMVGLSLDNVLKGEKTVIIVEGEEDLSVLPLLLLAPKGFVICYGQPHVGMVSVQVNDNTKKHALSLVSSFTTRGH